MRTFAASKTPFEELASIVDGLPFPENNLEASITFFRERFERDKPTDSLVREGLEHLVGNLNINDVPGALHLLRRAQARGHPDAEFFVSILDQDDSVDDIESVADLFDKYAPDDARTLFVAGMKAHQTGKYDLSIELLTQAVELNYGPAFGELGMRYQLGKVS